MKKIIIINGCGTSGKDEIIKITRSITKGDDELIVGNVSSVDVIKDKALLFGWDGEKDDEGRRLLSDLKDAWIRYNDGPFAYIKKYINNFHTQKNFIIFVHIRENTEIEKMVNYYGDLVTTLLIKRCGVKKYNNHADKDIENCGYDYIIENNGTLGDLKNSVETFLKDTEII